MSSHLRTLSLFAAIVLAAPAFAGKPRMFAFQPYLEQTIEYYRGQQVALERHELYAVGMRFVAQDNKHAWIEVSVQNGSPRSVVIGETSLEASSGGQRLAVYSFDDLARAEHRAEAWRSFGAGLSAAGNNATAANAGYSTTYGTYDSRTTANAFGSNGTYAYGNATTTGSFSATTYSAADALAAQAIADAKNRQLMAEMEAQNQYARNSLESRALRMNTLRPDGSIVGQIMIDLPHRGRKEPAPMSLSYSVGGERFTFSLVESLDKR